MPTPRDTQKRQDPAFLVAPSAADPALVLQAKGASQIVILEIRASDGTIINRILGDGTLEHGSGGGGGGGVTTIAADGSIVVTNPTGPTVTLSQGVPTALEVLNSLTVDQAAPGGGSVVLRTNPPGGAPVISAATPSGGTVPLLDLINAAGASAVHIDSDGAFTLPVVLPAPANGATTGLVRNLTSDDTLAHGDPVYVKSNGHVGKADATAAGKFPAVGVAATAVTAASVGPILIFGIATHNAWAWTPGLPLYLAAGVLSQSAPVVTGNAIQVVGMAEAVTRALIMPSLTWATHA